MVGITSIIKEAFREHRDFRAFRAEGMQFFRGLARNNNREWFQPRKPIFEEKVKQPMRRTGGGGERRA